MKKRRDINNIVNEFFQKDRDPAVKARYIEQLKQKQWAKNCTGCGRCARGVHEGQTVLDIGCSSGTFTIPAATLVGEYGTVYALDVNQGALEKLRIRAEAAGLKNIRTFLASADDKAR